MQQPETLKSNGTRVLTGDPFHLKSLARAVRTNGIKIPLELVITTYDILDASTRNYLAESFNCDVVEFLSMSETSCPIAWECPTHSGLHINEDYIVVEIVEINSDDPVPPGQIGEIVITDLHNHLMPLIRYRTGDLGAIIPEPCACGRALTLLTPVAGRVASTLSANGKLITVRDVLSEASPLGSGDIEVVISAKNDKAFVSYVAPIPDVNVNELRLQAKLERLFGINVHVEKVTAIKPTSLNKFRTVIIS